MVRRGRALGVLSDACCLDDPIKENPRSTQIVETKTSNTFKTLDKCIEACTDGEKGYAIAAAGVRDPMLKALFHE